MIMNKNAISPFTRFNVFDNNSFIISHMHIFTFFTSVNVKSFTVLAEEGSKIAAESFYLFIPYILYISIMWCLFPYTRQFATELTILHSSKFSILKVL